MKGAKNITSPDYSIIAVQRIRMFYVLCVMIIRITFFFSGKNNSSYEEMRLIFMSWHDQ